MKVFEHICLGVVSAAAAFLMVEWGLAAHSVSRDVSKEEAALEFTLAGINGVVGQTAVVEDQTFHAVQEFSGQLAAQAAGFQKSQLQVYKTITDIKEIMVRTDKSLNDVLVPKLSAALESTANLTTTAAANLNHTMNELQPTFDNFAKASAAAAATMADPKIQETVTHIDEAAAHTAEATDHTAKTVEHLEASAADVQTFIHRETAPIRGVWNTIKEFIKDFGATATGAIAASHGAP